MLAIVCRASIAALLDQLYALSDPGVAGARAASAGTLRELGAFAAALE
jgi:hypothetical protein